MGLVESDGLMEGGQGAGSFFIWEEAGKREAGMVIDGDVQAFDPGAGIAVGAIAGGADAGLMKAAQLFNIKVQEFAGGGAFITEDGRFGWFEGAEAVEAMALENAGQSGFGDGENHEDLGVGTALAAEGEDLLFELGRGFTGLVEWP